MPRYKVNLSGEEEKYGCIQAKNAMRQHVFDLQSAKKNVEMFLGITPEQDKQDIAHDKKSGRGDIR